MFEKIKFFPLPPDDIRVTGANSSRKGSKVSVWDVKMHLVFRKTV